MLLSSPVTRPGSTGKCKPDSGLIGERLYDHCFHCAVIILNGLFLIILNKESYASTWIKPQPRIIFTTLALNDLANGLLVLGVGIIPATFQCWPFGEFLCQIQVRQFNCNVCFKKIVTECCNISFCTL